jgi:hypothetical protein
MTDAPKYVRGDEPGLEVALSEVAAYNDDGSGLKPGTGWEIELSDDDWWETREEAEQAMQEYALAIADRVHGAELARLRAVEGTWIELLKRLRAAMIAELEALGDAGAFGFERSTVEVFDEASRALGLPISNDDGVPFELLPKAEVFKPTMESDGGWYYVVVSPTDRIEHDDLEDAAADFGERYAAWKANQR